MFCCNFFSAFSEFQDDWERSKEPVLEGVTFYAKYLGMCLVDLPNDEAHTTDAVKRILHNVSCSLFVACRGLAVIKSIAVKLWCF